MAELQVADALRSQLMFLLWQKNTTGLTMLTNAFPPESEFRVLTSMDTVCPIPFSYNMRHQALCEPLAARGIDDLVLIRVINHGLSGKAGHDSPLSVNMAVRVTLIRASDATQRETFRALYDGPSRKFKEWSSNNGSLFRAEFERGLQKVADQIFVRIPPLPASPKAPVDIVNAGT